MKQNVLCVCVLVQLKFQLHNCFHLSWQRIYGKTCPIAATLAPRPQNSTSICKRRYQLDLLQTCYWTSSVWCPSFFCFGNQPTPCNRDLENVRTSLLFKKCVTSDWTLMFITVFTKARPGPYPQLGISSVRPPILFPFFTFILILSFHICLTFTSPFPSVFQPKPCMHFHSLAYMSVQPYCQGFGCSNTTWFR
jgi:hypothetical protein